MPKQPVSPATSSNVERRSRDADRSREAILDAAEQLFADHGYLGASLQDIGDAAGVSRGTPSYFFGSKEGVYRAVLERIFSGVSELIRRELEEAVGRNEGPEAVFAREIEGYIGFLAERPNFVRLLQWEALSGDEVLANLTARLSVLRETERVIREESARGAFREIDPGHLMLNIIALCWYPFSQQQSLMKVIGKDAYDPAFVERHKKAVVQLVLDGIRIH
ncbi:TetR/AcrR family transcriptional regulator [soil metagenome]